MDFPELPKIKSVILVLENETYVTQDKHACHAIAVCFSLADRIWQKVIGKRPWKAVDRFLDGNKK